MITTTITFSLRIRIRYNEPTKKHVQFSTNQMRIERMPMEQWSKFEYSTLYWKIGSGL